MTRMYIAFVALVLSSACSGESLKSAMPTAPSASTPMPISTTIGAAASQTIVMGAPLSWQMADGCLIQKPSVPMGAVSGREPKNTVILGTGDLRAMWLDPERSSSQPVVHFDCEASFKETYTVEYYLVATFRGQGGEWRFCSGDSATKEQFVASIMSPDEIQAHCPK